MNYQTGGLFFVWVAWLLIDWRHLRPKTSIASQPDPPEHLRPKLGMVTIFFKWFTEAELSRFPRSKENQGQASAVHCKALRENSPSIYGVLLEDAGVLFCFCFKKIVLFVFFENAVGSITIKQGPAQIPHESRKGHRGEFTTSLFVLWNSKAGSDWLPTEEKKRPETRPKRNTQKQNLPRKRKDQTKKKYIKADFF